MKRSLRTVKGTLPRTGFFTPHLEVTHVDGVKPDEAGVQPDVGLGQHASGQVPLSQMDVS